MLLERALGGQESAFEALFGEHEERLRHAVELRLDRRLLPRVDVSDVMQETYFEAVRRLPEYKVRAALPFYLWLRMIAHDQVAELHRRHLGAEKRCVEREVPVLPAESSAAFVRSMAAPGPTPSEAAAEEELAEKLRIALEQLDGDERALVVWRHFEKLTHKEVASLLCVTEEAAGKRYIRALERLRGLLHELGVSKSG